MQPRYRFLAVFVFAVLTAAAPVLAGPPERTHDVEPDDYFGLATITSCAVSPQGDHVAYTEMRWVEALDGRNTDLWVVDCATKARRRLTFDKAADGGPAWSPDGKYIYFTSARKRAGEKNPPHNGKKQVWRVSRDGGEPLAVTRVEGGIGFYELGKDGISLYYTVTDEHFDDDFKKLRKKNKHLEYGHGVTDFSQVWKLDLESWRAEKIIDEKRAIKSMTVRADQKRIAMITAPDNEMITNEGWSRVDVYDATTEKISIVTGDGWRNEHPSPYGWAGNLAWSQDGGRLAWTVDFDGHPREIYVAVLSGDEPNLWMLTRPGEVTVSCNLQWPKGESGLAFIAEQRARQRIYHILNVEPGKQTPEEMVTPTPGDVVVHTYDVSDDGSTVAFVKSDTRHGRDLFLWRPTDSKGEWTQLTDTNPQIETWKLPQISLVQWKAPDGAEVEGILELPPDYKPDDGPLPMIVELHGGPTAATMYRLRLWIYGRTVMAAKGYALLSPNYRGSTGYGDKFLVGLVGHENDIEVGDILSGVDAMIERGIADPDRLGVMGWSNGGFLTNCVIAKTNRFKAASSGAGVLDMVIQWGSEDTPGHVVNYMEGLPWDACDAYRKASPIFGLAGVTTPTIVHVGGNDERCPQAHSRGLYRALHRYLNVPTELVIYPGEGHGLRKYKNRKAKMEWDLAWFDRHLLGKTDEEKDEGSQLIADN